jgi:hypothetical protein
MQQWHELKTRKGYSLQARDGEIGEAGIHEEGGTIRYLVADTREWLPGSKVLLATGWVQAIRWLEREIATDMERETLRTAPGYDGPQAIDKLYEVHRYPHCGIALGHTHEAAY